MHVFGRSSLFILVFATLSPLVSSQTAAPETRFSADVDVVNILATVRDRSGNVVRGLTAADFLLEDEGWPQTVRYFNRETDLPLTLGLLVDTSFSQERLLGGERVASRRFFARILRPDRDRAFLMHFDLEVELLADLTSSKSRLDDALDQLRVPGAPRSRFDRKARADDPSATERVPRPRSGTTHLYDAIQLASDELMRKRTGRKALVLLTDGVDVGSIDSLTDAVAAAQRADTLVYAVLFADPQAYSPVLRSLHPQRFDGHAALEKIATATGGWVFEVSQVQPIEAVYAAIEEDLRNLYSIGYSPDPKGSPGEYRRLRLVTRNPDLTVHGREGYYAAGAPAK